ncbi:MAG: four helix bundle protein [Acidobacteria bacterium]|nr:four helix bundle protein [Acidobacteriota bacterium]
MGAKHFTDLVAWQLSHKLKVEVDAILARPAAQRDGRFCAQASDAARSAPRNLAEGFGHFSHREFARFVRIARASLQETQNHLIDARDKGVVTNEEFDRLWKLSDEALAVVTGLFKYLTAGRKGRHE